ncbi:MAG TPA: cysteine hydrolase [Reyranella sp.]
MSAIVATRPSLAEMIDPKRTALVIIDVQVDFGAPDGLYGKVGCDLSRVEPAIDHMIELHDAARRAGVFTVFVRLETGPATDSMPAQERRLRNGTNNGGRPCLAGTPGAEYYRVKPRAGDAEVVKHRYSTFTNTTMEFVLRARPGLDTLVVCGLTTECCVDTAVRDAFVRDYHLFLPRDASASYRSDMHDTTFDIFAQYFAVVTTTADVTKAWTG